MPIELKSEAKSNLLEAKLSGKLVKEDYAHFVPEVDAAIKSHKKVRMLVEMADFHGWTASAAWEDIKFDLRHFTDFQRIAIVGETKWEHGMATFCKPFTTAKIHYFPKEHLAEARTWVAAE